MAVTGTNGQAPKQGTKAWLQAELDKAHAEVAKYKEMVKATSTMFDAQKGENKPLPVALIGMRGEPTTLQVQYQQRRLLKQDNPWRLDSNCRLKIRTASGTEFDWVNWKIQFNIITKRYRLITPGHYNGTKYVSTVFMRNDNMVRMLNFFLQLPIQEKYPKAEEKPMKDVKPAGPVRSATATSNEPAGAPAT